MLIVLNYFSVSESDRLSGRASFFSRTPQVTGPFINDVTQRGGGGKVLCEGHKCLAEGSRVVKNCQIFMTSFINPPKCQS